MVNNYYMIINKNFNYQNARFMSFKTLVTS